MRELTVDPSAAVERCYREHGEKIWRALLLYSGDREVANDAVAEAFAQALRRGGEIRDVERWVWRASFKIARGELQRRRRDVATIADVPVELPEDTVDLMRALAGLSPKQRGAAILRL
ncbi:MAG: RNA polymerase sigma factor [Actinomycetota bacterium]